MFESCGQHRKRRICEAYRFDRGRRAGRRCEPGGGDRRVQGFHGNLGYPAVFRQRAGRMAYRLIKCLARWRRSCHHHERTHTINRITEREVTNET